MEISPKQLSVMGDGSCQWSEGDLENPSELHATHPRIDQLTQGQQGYVLVTGL
jgi:hypothetical protein